ncbi:hypothetical protein [Novipirellula caenicola]|uniref:hypothetical protein n=1 Tax=Novipirellula caenicola TaxID=1536901 RepID=UPI0031E6238D
MEPLPADSETEFEFRDCVAGGRISRSYIAAVREGVIEALSCGLLGNYPVVGVRVVILDGMEHEKVT